MNSIIRRFDRAPLEDRLLRANPAQPPKPKSGTGGPPPRHAGPPGSGAGPSQGQGPSSGPPPSGGEQRPPRRANKKSTGKRPSGGPQSPFAEELAKVL
jgi:hypothetical protein